MTADHTTADLPPVLGLADLAPVVGVSVDVLRKRLAADDSIRELFAVIGGRYLAPSSVLPILVDRLAPKPVA